MPRVAHLGALLAAVMQLQATGSSHAASPRNFGHSIKNGHLVANTEQELFAHNCTRPPCSMTQLHCPAAGHDYRTAVVRMYVDGETTASIQLTLLELANVGSWGGSPPPPPAPGPGPPPAPPRPDPRVPPKYDEYYLGAQGQTCTEACTARGLTCRPINNTGFGVDKGVAMQKHLAQFNESIMNCSFEHKMWFAVDQPGYVCGHDSNGNGGDCIGWSGLPAAGAACSGQYPSQCRVCHCVKTAAPVAAPASSSGGAPPTGDGAAWGEALFGHTASNGGVYSTARVPFGKSIRLTLEAKTGGTFWFIARGMEDYPVVLGDLTLPAAARLHVHHFNATVKSGELVTLVELPNGTSGALFNVKFDAQSTNYGYLEACMRAYMDGAQQPMFLSSGAEDYFLSAYYFNEGEFKTPQSGLTNFNGHGTMSAYKVHDRDPIVFDNGFKLQFRNSESTSGCGSEQQCPNQFCAPGSAPDTSVPAFERAKGREAGPAALYRTTVWSYEWPSAPEAAGGEADEAATLAMLVTGGHLSEAQAASVGAAMARDGALLSVVRAHAQALDGARAARQILRRAGRTGR